MIIKYNSKGEQQVFEGRIIEIVTKEDIYYLHTLIQYDIHKLAKLKNKNYLYFANVNIECKNIVSINMLSSYIMSEDRAMLKALKMRHINGMDFYNEIVYK